MLERERERERKLILGQNTGWYYIYKLIDSPLMPLSNTYCSINNMIKLVQKYILTFKELRNTLRGIIDPRN